MSNDIKKLTPYQHVRLRTEMYFGSRVEQTQQIVTYDDSGISLKEMSWVPAVYTGFREILDNSLDEVIAHGNGNRIDVTYDEKTKIFSVKDNGRGIPIDWDEDHQCHKATLALSELMAGRNFGDRGQTAGVNGLGASGVNFCSTFFDMEIVRDGKKFTQGFTEHSEGFDEELQINKPVIKDSTAPTGTKITFKLSPLVFDNLSLPLNFVKDRIFEIATANPDVKFYFNGDHVKVKINPMQTLFGKTKPIAFDIRNEEIRSRFWIVNNFDNSGEHVHTVINNIFAINGGSHIDAFRKTFYTGLLKSLEKESKRRKLSPNMSDITDGVLLYNITNMDAPNFDSQSKTRLINDNIAVVIRNYFKSDDVFKDIIKKNKEWIDAIYERCARRTMKKDASEIEKLAKKNSRLKIAKLMDATGKDRSKCVLILGEGDSAIAGAAAVRNPEIHGGLPLRGKVLNVTGEDLKKVVNNAELTNITTALGLIIGQKADRENMRYGQVYIATDSDEDGKNIAALLVNFFNTFWPELLEDTEKPFLNIFQTPFIIMEKGKQRQYVYAHNYSEFDPKDYSGWQIIRAKGLGTLEEVDWKYALDNPLLFPIIKDENLNDTLDLIFNEKRADDRKEWIGM